MMVARAVEVVKEIDAASIEVNNSSELVLVFKSPRDEVNSRENVVLP